MNIIADIEAAFEAPPAAAQAAPAAPPPPPPAPAPVAAGGSFDKLADAIAAVAPRLDDDAVARWVTALTPPMQSSGFVTARRIAAIIGQMAVESAGFTALSENLNYSADGLRRVFPSHFPNGDEGDYARQPEKIANRVYASRLGNGNEASGDGWRFRGGGLIQTTGRTNYTNLARDMRMTTEECAAWVRMLPGAASSACWFLSRIGAAKLADAWAITDLSRRVNGGDNGLSERLKLSQDALDALS